MIREIWLIKTRDQGFRAEVRGNVCGSERRAVTPTYCTREAATTQALDIIEEWELEEWTKTHT